MNVESYYKFNLWNPLLCEKELSFLHGTSYINMLPRFHPHTHMQRKECTIYYFSFPTDAIQPFILQKGREIAIIPLTLS